MSFFSDWKEGASIVCIVAIAIFIGSACAALVSLAIIGISYLAIGPLGDNASYSIIIAMCLIMAPACVGGTFDNMRKATQ